MNDDICLGGDEPGLEAAYSKSEAIHAVLKEYRKIMDNCVDDFARRHAELLHENEQLLERRKEALQTIEEHRATIYQLRAEIEELKKGISDG